MNKFDLKEVTFQKIASDKMITEFPQYVIGNDQGCLDVLLDVLKNRNEAITTEVINLTELLQLNPKIKNYLTKKIPMLKSVYGNIEDEDVEDDQPNLQSWKQLLTWTNETELNQTYYMLTCLRELTNGK